MQYSTARMLLGWLRISAEAGPITDLTAAARAARKGETSPEAGAELVTERSVLLGQDIRNPKKNLCVRALRTKEQGIHTAQSLQRHNRVAGIPLRGLEGQDRRQLQHQIHAAGQGGPGPEALLEK